jgi:hypothetical protein
MLHAEKQQIPILQSLVWPDLDSNPRSPTLKASTINLVESQVEHFMNKDDIL